LMRQDAIRGLVDKAVIRGFAQDENVMVRFAVADTLNDPELLAAFAKDERNGDWRRDAVRKLTDQVLLAELAQNDTNPTVRQFATSMLTNQTLLSEIVKNDKDGLVRDAANRRLNAMNRKEGEEEQPKQEFQYEPYR